MIVSMHFPNVLASAFPRMTWVGHPPYLGFAYLGCSAHIFKHFKSLSLLQSYNLRIFLTSKVKIMSYGCQLVTNTPAKVSASFGHCSAPHSQLQSLLVGKKEESIYNPLLLSPFSRVRALAGPQGSSPQAPVLIPEMKYMGDCHYPSQCIK